RAHGGRLERLGRLGEHRREAFCALGEAPLDLVDVLTGEGDGRLHVVRGLHRALPCLVLSPQERAKDEGREKGRRHAANAHEARLSRDDVVACATMQVPVLSPRQMPERLGRYEIRAKIGEGGMAVVYLGHQAGEGERVAAVKVIKDEYSLNTDFVTMSMDEAKIVSRLDHSNIVKVYELGHEGNRLFIAMELLFGQSLWSIWNACRTRGIRLRYDLVAWIGARVAEGLHHAHELRG